MEPKYTIHLERDELVTLILGMYESADLHEAKGRPITASQHRDIARRLDALCDVDDVDGESQKTYTSPTQRTTSW